MKKILIILAILAMATMTSCELSAPVDTGSSVEVEMGGIEGSKGPAPIFADAATWVSINVVNDSNVQKGSGVLTKTLDNKWKGTIHIDETGTMRFIATAGTVASQVIWLGNNTYIVGTDIGKLTIGVGIPVANGTEYGPAGGKVFYAKGSYSDGWRYLEAAPSDQSTGIVWWNGSYTATKATATGIGSGNANMTKIIASQGGGSYAASLCAGLVLGGYDDWFLPSIDELNAMYGKKTAIGSGGFAFALYWSSSEDSSDENYALFQDFTDGSQFFNGKDNDGNVRAVRAF